MYNGFNLKIGDKIVPNEIIVPGSYQPVFSQRVAAEWEDGKGIKHYDYYAKTRTTISFEIKPRTGEQQDSIRWLFSRRNDLLVTYYDDLTGNYLTGTFEMKPVALTHSYDGDKVYYAVTKVELEEH